MKQYLLISMSILMAFSCYGQKMKPITLNLAKAITEKTEEMMLSEIATDIRYIPIETREDCLFGKGFDIRYMEDNIFAVSGESYFRFDKNGKFLNKIGNKGQGPEEYTMGLFYYIDPVRKYVGVPQWNGVVYYTYEGDFVKRLSEMNINMGTVEMFGKDCIVYSNDMYFANKKSPDQLFVVDMEGKQQGKMKGYIEEGKRYGINLTTRDYMYIYEGNTYFRPALENVVYRIESPTKKSIAWKFDCSGKGIDVSRDERDVKNRAKFIAVYQLMETKDYLFVLYGLDKNTYCGKYDKKEKRFCNVEIKDDLAGGIDFCPAGKCAAGYLEMAYYPNDLKGGKRYSRFSLPNRKKEIDDLWENLDDDDNPVLIVVTLKE